MLLGGRRGEDFVLMQFLHAWLIEVEAGGGLVYSVSLSEIKIVGYVTHTETQGREEGSCWRTKN